MTDDPTTNSSSGSFSTNHIEAPTLPALCRTYAYKATGCLKPYRRRGFSGAFLGAAVLLLAFTAPAQAQVLVSNTGQTTHGYTACVAGSQPPGPADCAQGFTTGQNTRGYDLASIDLDVATAPGSGTLTVTVRAASGSGHPRNQVLYTLTNPTNVGTGVQKFTAPGDAHLNRNTQYFVHITFSGSGTRPRWNLTANDNQDSGAHIGWSIGNHRYTRQSGGTGGWEGDGGVYSASIQIRVNGNTLAPPAPTNLTAMAGDRRIALSWDDPGNNTIGKYQFSRNAGATFPGYNDISGSSATTTAHTLTSGLTNGTRYTLGVRAVNIGGQGAVATVTATPLWPAPANLAATPGNGQVALEWDRGDSGIARYQVSTTAASGSATPETSIVPSGSGSKTTALVSGLTSGTVYTFTVQAVKISGSTTVITGKPSSVTATTLPAAPTNLWPDPGDGEVTLSWTDPDRDTITGYQVSTDGGTDYTAIGGSNAATVATTVTGLSNGTEYPLALRAVNVSGSGPAATVTATPLARPAAPELSATPGDGRVTLSWTNPGNNTIRKYQYRTADGATFTDISGSSWTTTTHTVTGLSNGTQYPLALRAVNASGGGAAATVDVTPVWAAPANLSATPGSEQVTLTWTGPGDSTITKYQVSTDGTTFTDIDTSGSSAATINHAVTGLTNGTTYPLALRAANASAHGAAATVTATPLWPAPGLLAEPGDEKVVLTWNTDSGVDEYQIHSQVTSGGATPDISYEEAGSGTKTTTTIADLTNGTEYTFTVQAVDRSGNSAVITGLPANANATPAPVPHQPTNLSATQGDDRETTLTWTDPNDSTITGYQVNTDGGTIYTDIGASNAATTAYTVTGLTNGTAYSLAVRAKNDSGSGPASAVTATPLWPAPTGLVATPDSGRVVLEWDTGDSEIALYAVRTTLTGTQVSDNAHQSGSGNKTTATVTGLTNGTEYTFTVRAASGTSASFQITGVASTDTATPAVALPAAPTGLTPTARSQEVALTWTDPNNITITKYQVSTEAGAGTNYTDIPNSGQGQTNATGYIVTGLTNGIQYTFKLRAVNASGAGDASSVTATPIAKPAAPVNFAATRGSDGGEVALTWDDPGNVPITGYQYRQKRGNRAFGDWSDIDGSGATTVSHTVTGLSNGREYTVELRAVNASGEGAASSDKATPLWPAPTFLTVTPDHGRVHLEWTGVPGAKDYTLTTKGPGVNWSSFLSFSASPSKVDDSIGLNPNHPLTNGDVYTFTVWSTTAGGTQTSVKASVEATPVAPPLPAAPTISSATPGDSRVVLKWDDPGNITITKYQVRWKVKDSNDSTYTDWAEITSPNPYATPPTPPTTYTATGLTNGTTYTFEVRAGNGSGEGPASTVDAKPSAIPDAPVNLSATAGDGQVALSWDNPEDDTIQKHQVRWKVKDDDDSTYTIWVDTGSSGADTLTHTVTGLSNGTRYTFAVRAVNATGNGLVATVNARPIAVPAAPTNLTATPGHGQVALEWDDPGDSTIIMYQYSTDGGTNFTDIGGTDISEDDADNTLTFIVTRLSEDTMIGLSDGTEYSLALRAVNDSGTGAAASVTATMLPAAPANLAATQGDDRQTTLSWDDPNNSTISRYEYRQAEGQGITDYGDWGDWSEISPSSAATTAYTVTGLTNGTRYKFELSAVNASGTGAASPDVTDIPVTATPLWPAPANLVATPGDAQVMLMWDTGDLGITRYAVHTYYTHVSDEEPLFERVLSPGTGEQTTVVLAGLTNGTDYTFTVQAAEGSGNTTVITGNPSSVDARPVPVPAAPNLEAIPANQQVLLTWDDPGDSSISKYQYRQRVSGADFGDWSDIGGSGADTIEHTVTGLTNGEAYGFALRAVNASGDGEASSVGATPIAVPNAPQNLMATPRDRQAALEWNTPSNGVPITGYEYSTDDGTTFANIDGSNADTTTYTVEFLSNPGTPLTNGTEYTFAVRAVNDLGAGPAATDSATPMTVPAAPDLEMADPADSQVGLTWEHPNDDTITSYQLSIDDGTTFTTIENSTADTTAHTVTELTNGTEYKFRVLAANVIGPSASSAVNATPFNTAPTGSHHEVFTNQNEPYAFTVNDFAFIDVDAADTLHHVKITSLPGADAATDQGTLALDDTALADVTTPPQVTEDDLRNGRLTYTPPGNAHGEPLTTFRFKVHDGEVDSESEYTMTIHVVTVRAVSFGAADYAVDEGGDAVTITVRLSAPADRELRIPIGVTPQDEAVAADYEVVGLAASTDPEVAGTLTLGVGDDTGSFTIEARQDDDFHDETVLLAFGALPLGAVEGEPATATLTIADREGVAIRARFRRLNNEILSKHALTIADVTNRAIGARMDDRCGQPAAAYTLAGEGTIYQALRANLPALEAGTLTLGEVLVGSSFLLPLGAANDDLTGGSRRPVLWGRGDRDTLGSNASALAWDGTVLTAQVGIDGCPRADLVTGLTLSHSVGTFGYTDGTGQPPVSGDYTSRMTSLHPYLGWASAQGLSLWATLGYGLGAIRIDDEQAGEHTSDTRLLTAATGARGPVLAARSLIAGGTTTLMIKGEASVAQVQVAGNDHLIEQQQVNARRVRLALEGSHEQALGAGGSLTPSVELGLRYDGGDGATGAGLEIGGGLGYRFPALGLTVEGRGRVLLAQRDYREWGVGGSLSIDPGAGGHGVSVRVAPVYGAVSSGVAWLWNQDAAALTATEQAANDGQPPGRLEAEIGYGLSAFGGHGLLTPYAGFSLIGADGQRYRLGGRLAIGSAFTLGLEGERRERGAGGAVDYGVVLGGQARW